MINFQRENAAYLWLSVMCSLTDQLFQEGAWTGVKEDGKFSRFSVQHDPKVTNLHI